jgi:hypothetical protein
VKALPSGPGVLELPPGLHRSALPGAAWIRPPTDREHRAARPAQALLPIGRAHRAGTLVKASQAIGRAHHAGSAVTALAPTYRAHRAGSVVKALAQTDRAHRAGTAVTALAQTDRAHRAGTVVKALPQTGRAHRAGMLATASPPIGRARHAGAPVTRRRPPSVRTAPEDLGRRAGMVMRSIGWRRHRAVLPVAVPDLPEQDPVRPGAAAVGHAPAQLAVAGRPVASPVHVNPDGTSAVS